MKIQFLSHVALRWVNISRRFGDVVISYLCSITERSQDVECLIQLEEVRHFETPGCVYWPTSKGKGKAHPGT
jgi:hypothetical protein